MKMKNKRIRIFTVLLAVVLCMTAFSTVAYADGGGGEPYYTDPEPTPTPEPEESPDTTGGYEPEPLTPDGNMTLVDDIDGEASGDKQFITVVTKNGNYFYIIIDRADDGENTVHFLNQVDEADLLALMEGDKAEAAPAVCTCTEKCEAGAVNTSCPVCKSNMSECAGKEAVTTPEPEAPEKESAGGSGLIILLVLLLIGGGGALVYFKLIKPKQNIKGGTDIDELDFDEDDDISEPEAAEQEDEE